MQLICAWCKRTVIEHEKENGNKYVISHGICEECAANMQNPDNKSLREYLDDMKAPVLVVDEEGTILIANKAISGMLGKKVEDIEAFKGGVAMECAYARLPEGCGNTIHCKTCTIRNNVMETFVTGKCKNRTPAFLDQVQGDDVGKLEFFISTEKVGDLVLLRIDKDSGTENGS